MSRKEPIAIIGIGCRFPGRVRGPEAFWKLLCDGVDAISEVPPDRWNPETFYDQRPGQKGKSISRWMGSVEGIDKFDAGFFGVSPREAECMDPQQRLLLQTAWEALDDGGEVLDTGRGSAAGVFVGISTYDYALLQSTPDNQSAIDVYTGTGGAMSIAANRVSHCLNLHGPSLAVDTACSSSLVALHLACTSLWQGECPLAFVGGVNAIITPATFIGFSQSGMLSPDGRCKAFDATANGFVRSEGCGVVLLKPLSAALADGNPVYAVIRGTAANQDGRTNGISLPSAAAQEALVREACRAGGISPWQVQYVEAHGTGTLVGDPIEAAALGAALCDERDPRKPLLIGSVKTNIGHLEAGAGIAGIIKTALALKHGKIPPSLHCKNPNPLIDFEKLKLRVPAEIESFRNGTELPIAGVNSFGFGGTNAHAILQSFGSPAKARIRRRAGEPDRRHLLALSARCEQSLGDLAEKYVAFLLREDTDRERTLSDICFTAGAHRTQHPHRLCVAAASRQQIVEKLQAYLAGEARSGLSAAETSAEPRPVFVFSGQGPQWWGMGRELVEHEPVFREKLQECDAVLGEFTDWSLIQEMTCGQASSRMNETAIAQPAIFALQVALTALWQSWGITPGACVGHSVGEVAAAQVAGVLSLRDAVRVIFQRGRCMEQATKRGKMIAAGLSWDEAERVIRPWTGRVSVAALNSPNSVTFSGDSDAIDDLAALLTQGSIFCRPLRVNYAFHSHQMDPVRDELLRALGAVETQPASIELFSTVTGAECAGDDFAADYWWRNVRMPVRFGTAIDALIDRGHGLFLEIGPHPALTGSLRECMTKRSVTGPAIASLRRGEDERLTMLGSLGALHAAGCEINWKALYPSGSAVRLPSYAWREEPYWHEATESRASRLGGSTHPLLARRTQAADPTWHTRLDLNAIPHLRDHVLQEHILFPAAGYVEMALGAASALFDGAPTVIEEIDFQKALILKESDNAARIQFCHRQLDSTFTISSCSGSAGDIWTVNSVGKMRALPQGKGPIRSAPESLDVAHAKPLPSDSIYDRFRELGLSYGPLFRCIETAWQCDGEALGRIQLPESLRWESARYRIHPTMLDACFQLLLLTVRAADPTMRPALHLPVQIERFRFFSPPGERFWCHARLVQSNARVVVGDLTIRDERGSVFARIEGFRCQAVNRSHAGFADELLYQVAWKLQARRSARPAPLPATPIVARKIAKQIEATAKRIRSDATAECDANKFTASLDPLCRFYLLSAFREMGWELRRGDRVNLAALQKRLRVARKHRQIFARFISFLEEDGLLSRWGEDWKVRSVPKVPDIGRLWREALSEFPGALAELNLLRACGPKLAGVLRGKTDPLTLIFPDGSLAGAEHLYQDSASFRGSNQLVAETVAAVEKERPEGRTLRILEIGAGTGGMTSHVLPRLRADRTEYVFSDISQLFLVKAEQKFFDFPFLRYQLLDIEKPPEHQDFTPNSFDVVLASDAIHATADLQNALANVRSLLAPGGLFVLLEVDRPARWLDLVFGLTEGWWRFTDTDLRPSYPLLRGPDWLRLLRGTGFLDTCAIPDRSDSARARQAIFLGRNPAATSRRTAPVALDLHPNGHKLAWLLFADPQGTADALATLLRQRGDHVISVRAAIEYRRSSKTEYAVNPGSPHDMRRLLAEVRAEGPSISRAVHFWSLEGVDSALVLQQQAENCHSLLHLVQALSADAASEVPRLILVTRGARRVAPAEKVSIAPASMLGLAGVIANEYPKFRCRTIDLAADETSGELPDLFAELLADDDEDEVALRSPARYVSRITRTSANLHARAGRGGVRQKSYRVEIDNPGALDHLIFRERPIRKPGPDEVVFSVKAAALNFRDVMKALGIYPGDKDDDALLGDECSGEVSAVGRNVKHLRAGDGVLAIVPGAFASHITIPAAQVVRKPGSLSFAAASTIPIAFLTAWHALHNLGKIQEGDRVLIQAATGGVGLAALQVARLAGAEIFATAGSAEKREFLRAQGLQHVMDSRSLAFADHVREITGGKGVDLILNSLAGDAIAAGISTLATGGRFVEIGKRDIYQNSRIGLRPFRNNASFFVMDLGQLVREDPMMVVAMLKRIMPLFGEGRLRPLPLRLFDVAQISGALRHMSQARHIGKIVVAMGNNAVVPLPPLSVKPVRFRSNASYLVTGGLGGFGLAVAAWILRNGGGHVVLASRKGAATEVSRRAVAALKKLGGVLVVKADVSLRRDVARIFKTVGRKLPPVRGIVHAAMVLDDGVLAQQTVQRFNRVMAPKVGGGWNLHLESQALPLDFFVLFSSIAAIAGSPGQGGYVAANSFLEALAQHRRAQGLPGLAVSWGVISDVGFVARNEKLNALLAHNGLLGITPARALGILGKLLQGNVPQFVVGRVDWRKLADGFPFVGTSPRFSEIVEARKPEQASDGLPFREQILSLPATDRLAVVTSRLRDQIAKVLRTSAAKLDTERALNELGLDSLMGVELLNRIETSLGIALAPGHLAAGNSISQMAAQLLETIAGKAGAPELTPQQGPARAVTPSCLVPLRTGRSGEPLFCIHPAGGLVNIYEGVVQHLPSELPVYGVQSRALFDDASEHSSISEMAHHYTALIQGRAPRGAIQLLGFSLGGFLAMAVARAFEDTGRAVAFVGLIDADLRWTADNYLKSEFLRQRFIEMYRLFARELKLLKPLDARTLTEFATAIGAEINHASSATRVEAIFRSVMERGYVSPGLPDRLVKHYLSLYFIHLDLLAGWKPAAVRAPLVIWSGRETRAQSAGWRQLATGTFEEKFIDGAHYDLMYPPLVSVMAAQIGAALGPQSLGPPRKRPTAPEVSANGNGASGHRTSRPLVRS